MLNVVKRFIYISLIPIWKSNNIFSTGTLSTKRVYLKLLINKKSIDFCIFVDKSVFRNFRRGKDLNGAIKLFKILFWNYFQLWKVGKLLE